MAGRLQNEDHKTKAEIIAAGGTAAQLLNDTKVYVTANSINDTLDQAIISGQIGSGGSKNYLANPKFTIATAGIPNSWSVFKTTLTSLIPTGSIGSADAGISVTQSGTTPLEGLYSALLDGSSSFAAGNGLISAAFTIDLEDQAKVMGWSFYYQAVTSNMDFPGTSANTWAVYIYDVTNSAWIQPAGVYNLPQSSGAGLASGTFQTTSNSTQYRIALICINSEAAATTLKVDDFQLGPQKVVYGSPVTDWQQYSPSASFVGFGTVSATNMWSRRVGDSLEVLGTFTCGTPTATTAQIPLGFNGATANVTVDSSKAASGVAVGVTPLSGSSSTNNAYHFLSAGAQSYVNIAIQGDSNSGIVAAQGSTLTGAATTLRVSFRVPILGWSSSVQMSNDTDTRVVAARSVSSNSGAWPTSDTVINFASVSYDTHGAITTGAGWNYRIPVSGYYKVSASHQGTSSGATTLILRARKNGSVFATALFPTNSAITNAAPRVDGQNYFNAGDTIDIVASSSAGGTFVDSTSVNVVQIERLSGPATIAASETVAASAIRSLSDGSQTFSSSAGQTFRTFTEYYPTDVIDTHGFVTNTASDTYATIPISGVYEIIKTCRYISASGTAIVQSYIILGGTNQTNAATADGTILAASLTQADSSDGRSITVSYIGRLNAGDIIRFKVMKYADTNLSMTQDTFARFQIKRVGN